MVDSDVIRDDSLTLVEEAHPVNCCTGRCEYPLDDRDFLSCSRDGADSA